MLALTAATMNFVPTPTLPMVQLAAVRSSTPPAITMMASKKDKNVGKKNVVGEYKAPIDYLEDAKFVVIPLIAAWIFLNISTPDSADALEPLTAAAPPAFW